MKRIQKKQIVRIVLLTATAVSLFVVPWILVKAWILPLPDSVQAQLEEAIDHGFKSVIVYADRGGAPPEYYAAGWHDPKNKIPANPNALFKIASISKLYVAAAVSKLAADGRLSLDETVADYFPELVGRIEYADDITLRMLVQNRSGIPDFTRLPNYWGAPKETNEERLALVLDLPAHFKPGEEFEYSNTNYLLLREVMDKVLGYPHFEFIREAILDRLNLKNTYGSLSEVSIDDVVSGYDVSYPLDIKTDNQGMLATAEDVGVFIRALNDGSIFDGSEQEIYSELYRYDHTGLIPGYQSIARYHEELDAVVVQFTGPTNFEGYNWNLSEIVYGRIVKILQRKEDVD